VELKKLLNSGDPPLLLDVREAKELGGKLGHLENVINIPIGSLAGRLSEFEGKEEQEIVTICHSGMRANTAAQILIRAGFKKVKVLKGGMLAWKETAA
jgi:rhodanese-related sulfurtransferase